MVASGLGSLSVWIPHESSVEAARAATPARAEGSGRRRLFEHLLIAPLHRAVAATHGDHVPVQVSGDLHLDVAATTDELLAEHVAVAERGGGLARRRLVGRLELVAFVHEPDAAPADLRLEQLQDLLGRSCPPQGASLPGPEDEEGAALWRALEGETLTGEELSRRTGRDLRSVLGRLVELELDGRVGRAPGGLYSRRG